MTRIDRLRSTIERDAHTNGEDDRAYEDLLCESFAVSRDLPEVMRKTLFLEGFARHCPIRIADDELIVGPHFPLVKWDKFLAGDQRKSMDVHGNMGHYIVDYGRVLRQGIDGLRSQVSLMKGNGATVIRNREAFARTLEGFSLFIRRHADEAARRAKNSGNEERKRELDTIAETCRRIAIGKPTSFREALQLVWFIQVFLQAEITFTAVSFGRFDQFLWPFLKADLANGSLSMEDAEELLACFWLKCCTIGDPAQNLIVGGIDEQGGQAENLLSLLCLDVARKLKVEQPSLSVRIGPETSEKFWRKAAALCATGIGMPAFFNDPVVIRALEAVDLPTERARDWGIVGCYEACPQGDTQGMTVAGGFALPEVLLEFLRQGPQAGSFAALLDCFKDYLRQYYVGCLVKFQNSWNEWRETNPSPFESLCMTGCIESGLTAEEGGARYTLFGVNILGLGTTVDSLLVIKELVYEKIQLSLAGLVDQLNGDFSDERLLWQCRAVGGRYGSDGEFTNQLARDLSRFLSDLVLESRLEHGVRPYPAFFWWLKDIYLAIAATPDGRRAGDRISYGAGPSVLSAPEAPTSILNSARWVAHDRSACGNPVAISLRPVEIRDEAGLQRIRQLVETYFQEGGSHLHFNIIDAERLRAAKRNPQEYPDLMVRISGYSARFTALDATLQDALIERIERGM